MSKTTRALLARLIGVAILAVLIVWGVGRLAPEAPSSRVAAAPKPAAPAAAPDVAVDDDLRIDYFELGPDGLATVAGSARPGAQVTLMLDGAPLETIEAGPDGAFAAFPRIASSDRLRPLTFEVDGSGRGGTAIFVQPGKGATASGVAEASPAGGSGGSGEKVADAEPDAAGTDGRKVSETVADAAPDVADTKTTVATAQDEGGPPAAAMTQNDPGTPATASPAPETDAPGLATAGPDSDPAEVGAAPETQVAAPTVIIDAAGVRAASSAPQVMDRVALDAISYDDSGEVRLAGRGPATGELQVYIDNRPVSRSDLAASGGWQLTLPDVDPGTYTLRIDQLDETGAVASRIETPFLKEDPATVRALRRDGGTVRQISTRTVQPGATLWAIATDRFADGMMYVAIFEANRAQIRDPDLIYPGQVFVLPETVPVGIRE